ncbi:hypothetical protein LshimejAT787_0111830 [Lyophyllum shimeji]|uniref:Uncharacterized protein n=1 Tax=Lyophyllum shimeji TaxID=47721 RepID=A0A9P3UHN6_LYOSH|nr:hypothetical protein LshimejAT787_0111830 [Lyophyllum shimeji]
MPPRHTLRGWILHFEELAQGYVEYQTHEIILEMDSNMPTDEVKNNLGFKIHKTFNRLIYWDNDRFWKMVIVGADGEEHPITLPELAAYLRDLPLGPRLARPNLLGYGTNKLRVEFEYDESYEVLKLLVPGRWNNWLEETFGGGTNERARDR